MSEEGVGGGKKTVMLCNIPGGCVRDQVLECLNQKFGGTFNVLYMPRGCRNHCNMFRAAINFRHDASCKLFVASFRGSGLASCLEESTVGAM